MYLIFLALRILGATVWNNCVSILPMKNCWGCTISMSLKRKFKSLRMMDLVIMLKILFHLPMSISLNLLLEKYLFFLLSMIILDPYSSKMMIYFKELRVCYVDQIA